MAPIRGLLRGTDNIKDLWPFELEWCNFFHVCTVFLKYLIRITEQDWPEYRHQLSLLDRVSGALEGGPNAPWELPYKDTHFKESTPLIVDAWLMMIQRLLHSYKKYWRRSERDRKNIATHELFALQFCLHILPSYQKNPEDRTTYGAIEPDHQDSCDKIQKGWEIWQKKFREKRGSHWLSVSDSVKIIMDAQENGILSLSNSRDADLRLRKLIGALRNVLPYFENGLSTQYRLLKKRFREDPRIRSATFRDFQELGLTCLIGLRVLYQEYLVLSEKGSEDSDFHKLYRSYIAHYEEMLQENANKLLLGPIYKFCKNSAIGVNPAYQNAFLCYFHFLFGHLLYFANCSQTLMDSALPEDQRKDAQKRKESWLKQIDACLGRRKKFFNRHFPDLEKNDWGHTILPDVFGQTWHYRGARDEAKTVLEEKWPAMTCQEIEKAMIEFDKEKYTCPPAPEGRHGLHLFVVGYHFLHPNPSKLHASTTKLQNFRKTVLATTDPAAPGMLLRYPNFFKERHRHPLRYRKTQIAWSSELEPGEPAFPISRNKGKLVYEIPEEREPEPLALHPDEIRDYDTKAGSQTSSDTSTSTNIRGAPTVVDSSSDSPSEFLVDYNLWYEDN